MNQTVIIKYYFDQQFDYVINHFTQQGKVDEMTEKFDDMTVFTVLSGQF